MSNLPKKSIVFLLICAILYTGLFVVSAFLFKHKTIDISEIYKESGSIEYNVNIYKNNFYSSNTLAGNDLYISKLIKSITTNFNYRLDMFNQGALAGNFDIIAQVEVFEDAKTESVLFVEDDVLKTGQFDGKYLYINETLDVDYEKYNKRVKDFKDAFGVVAKGSLNVFLRVSHSGTSDRSLTDEDVLLLTVPLDEKTVQIQINDKNANGVGTISQNINNYSDIIAGTCLVLPFVHILLTLLIRHRRRIKRYTPYELKVQHLFSSFGKSIVEIKNQYVFGNAQMLQTNSFHTLLDASEIMSKPILFYENRGKQIGTFVLPVEGYTLYFMLHERSAI